MAEKVKDNSLDFVFIDADHRYEAVKADICAWTPKLKPGGLLSGHDIHYSSVHRAVEKLIPSFEEVGFDHIWFAKKEDFTG
jgi:predicted O-methyltransferase YrrM